LTAATFTPMKASGDIDPDRVADVVKVLEHDGVSSLFVCGSSGEFASLTVAERKAVAEAYAAAARGSLPVIVHVGHDSLRAAAELAEHAAGIGAAAVAAAPPSYFKPAGVEAVLACCETICRASDLPLYYYHIPVRTGVNVKASDLLSAAGRRLPRLAGLKFTHDDLADLLLCMEIDGGRYDCLSGRDEALYAALALGCRGAVGTFYNVLAPVFRRVVHAAAEGRPDEALDWQRKANRAIRIALAHGGLPAAKAMMKLAGVDVGPVRLPFEPLRDVDTGALERELREIGFFEWGRGAG
jgi:N-acetylneuraminate lyase